VSVIVELAPPAPLAADAVAASTVVELLVDPAVGNSPVVVPPLSELERAVVVTGGAVDAAGIPAVVNSPSVVLVPEIAVEARSLLPVV